MGVHWCTCTWKPEDNLGTSAVVPQVGSCPSLSAYLFARQPACLPACLFSFFYGQVLLLPWSSPRRLDSLAKELGPALQYWHSTSLPSLFATWILSSYLWLLFFKNSPYVFQAASNFEPSASAFQARMSGMCHHSQGNVLTFWRNEWTSDIYLKDRQESFWCLPSGVQLLSCDRPQRLDGSFRKLPVALLYILPLISPKLTWVTCNQVCTSGEQACPNSWWPTPTRSAAQRLLLEHHRL